jgi:hypothetical protein
MRPAGGAPGSAPAPPTRRTALKAAPATAAAFKTFERKRRLPLLRLIFTAPPRSNPLGRAQAERLGDFPSALQPQSAQFYNSEGGK